MFLSQRALGSDQRARPALDGLGAKCCSIRLPATRAHRSSRHGLRNYGRHPCGDERLHHVRPVERPRASRSDRTAIVVIGVDPGAATNTCSTAYAHRMKLTARWEFIKSFKRKWEAPIPACRWCGSAYERYGMQVDLEVDRGHDGARKTTILKIEELNTPRQRAGTPRDDRIRAAGARHPRRPVLSALPYLSPRLRCRIATGAVWNQEMADRAAKKRAKGRKKRINRIGQIVYWKVQGPTKRQAQGARSHRVGPRRCVAAMRTATSTTCSRAFIEGGCCCIPSAPTRTLIDATSRVYDPRPACGPMAMEGRATTEPIGLEADEVMEDALENGDELRPIPADRWGRDFDVHSEVWIGPRNPPMRQKIKKSENSNAKEDRNQAKRRGGRQANGTPKTKKKRHSENAALAAAAAKPRKIFRRSSSCWAS